MSDVREFTKVDKINRFLYKCGVLLNDVEIENPPHITKILESLQFNECYDIVLAVIKSEQYGIDRKLNAISHVLEMEIEHLPTVLRREKDKVSHDATINVWDYTWEGYQRILEESK